MSRADIDAVERYFEITSTLVANGCEHGFKPAADCPNCACEAKLAHQAWKRICDAAGTTPIRESN